MRTILAVLISIQLFGCGDDDEKMPEFVGTLHAITLEPGANWDFSKTPEELAAGILAPHLAEIESRFKDKRLVANGTLETGAGLYFYDADKVDNQNLLDSDPGIQEDILKVAKQQDWQLLLANFGVDIGTMSVFVFEYRPGSGFVSGKTFLEQDITGHSDYMGGLFGEGKVLAGGVIGTDNARYLVLAKDKDAARAIANADPSVAASLLAVDVLLWSPLFRRALDE